GDVRNLVLVGVDVGADDLQLRGPRGDRRDCLLGLEPHALAHQVIEEVAVAFLISGDGLDQGTQGRIVDLRRQPRAERGVFALAQRHAHERLDLAEVVGPVALHHVLDADGLVGHRVDVARDHQVLPQHDRMQVLLGGPPADPRAPPVLKDEVLDELAMDAGHVVLGDQHDLQRVGDVFGQRDLRRVPIAPTHGLEVLATVERHEVVRVPGHRGVDVSVEVLPDHRSQLRHQRRQNRFLCHAVTLTQICGNRKIRRGMPLRQRYSARPGYSGLAASSSVAAACTRSAVPSAIVYFALDGAAAPCAGCVFFNTSTTNSATRSKSAAPKPRVVSAGVPNRMPLVYQAPLGSDGMALRLVTMPESSSADSACRPVTPNDCTSSSTMWLSVPPVTSRAPRRKNPSASALALSATRWAYAWNDG